ncbi:hypothetical protein JY97_04840 [Alkalispirochaeta odontotermitis]|nr:hypothetical protein JY97_04840 [Alkalispirochaeta odontotermitis]CAB1069971.1 hypothetical protein D1AOALGA4SA_802 [Olavius algarvensis Delta 1 endosymbiont]
MLPGKFAFQWFQVSVFRCQDKAPQIHDTGNLILNDTDLDRITGSIPPKEGLIQPAGRSLFCEYKLILSEN